MASGPKHDRFLLEGIGFYSNTGRREIILGYDLSASITNLLG
jgi:hypothetical protein